MPLGGATGLPIAIGRGLPLVIGLNLGSIPRTGLSIGIGLTGLPIDIGGLGLPLTGPLKGTPLPTGKALEIPPPLAGVDFAIPDSLLNKLIMKAPLCWQRYPSSYTYCPYHALCLRLTTVLG